MNTTEHLYFVTTTDKNGLSVTKHALSNTGMFTFTKTGRTTGVKPMTNFAELLKQRDADRELAKQYQTHKPEQEKEKMIQFGVGHSVGVGYNPYAQQKESEPDIEKESDEKKQDRLIKETIKQVGGKDKPNAQKNNKRMY